MDRWSCGFIKIRLFVDGLHHIADVRNKGELTLIKQSSCFVQERVKTIAALILRIECQKLLARHCEFLPNSVIGLVRRIAHWHQAIKSIIPTLQINTH